jgi:hypothetical protein
MGAIGVVRVFPKKCEDVLAKGVSLGLRNGVVLGRDCRSMLLKLSNIQRSVCLYRSDRTEKSYGIQACRLVHCWLSAVEEESAGAVGD